MEEPQIWGACCWGQTNHFLASCVIRISALFTLHLLGNCCFSLFFAFTGCKTNTSHLLAELSMLLPCGQACLGQAGFLPCSPAPLPFLTSTTWKPNRNVPQGGDEQGWEPRRATVTSWHGGRSPGKLPLRVKCDHGASSLPGPCVRAVPRSNSHPRQPLRHCHRWGRICVPASCMWAEGGQDTGVPAVVWGTGGTRASCCSDTCPCMPAAHLRCQHMCKEQLFLVSGVSSW